MERKGENMNTQDNWKTFLGFALRVIIALSIRMNYRKFATQERR